MSRGRPRTGRVYKPHEPSTLESLAADLPPLMVILAAMLRDQIDTLALLWAKGLWSEDPAELHEVAREGELRGLTKLWVGWERQCWGAQTDALIELLAEETPIRIDRGRILSLARARGEHMRALEERRAA